MEMLGEQGALESCRRCRQRRQRRSAAGYEGEGLAHEAEVLGGAGGRGERVAGAGVCLREAQSPGQVDGAHAADGGAVARVGEVVLYDAGRVPGRHGGEVRGGA